MAALAVLGAAGQFQLVARAAGVAGLPAESLAKVFQRLGRRGLLDSRRGPGGGYALSRPARLISLAEIARAADDGLPVERLCALGGHLCRSGGCLIHADVQRADSILLDSLAELTLQDLVKHKAKTIGGAK